MNFLSFFQNVIFMIGTFHFFPFLGQNIFTIGQHTSYLILILSSYWPFFCKLRDLNIILSKLPKIRLYFHYLFASTLRDLTSILSKNLPLCTLEDLTLILSKFLRFRPYFHYLFSGTLEDITLILSKILKIAPNFQFLFNICWG